jgi:hypothetical protein
MSRTNIIKLYVDDDELSLIEKIAQSENEYINRYLRKLIWKDAIERGHNQEKFLKIYIEEK